MAKEKKKKQQDQEYRSFKEFRERFYPASSEEELISIDDPVEFGIVLAERSLKKLRLSLEK